MTFSSHAEEKYKRVLENLYLFLCIHIIYKYYINRFVIVLFIDVIYLINYIEFCS